MNFLIIFLSAFLLSMFFINLSAYLKSPRFNKWVNGKVDAIEVQGEDEVWTIKWEIPSNLKDKNPQGSQHYYIKFKHHQKWGNAEDQKKYIKEKIVKNIYKKYYLSLKVDKSGIIREVGKYNNFLTKAFFYAILLIFFIGLIIWKY